jgi:hypothetical protein
MTSPIEPQALASGLARAASGATTPNASGFRSDHEAQLSNTVLIARQSIEYLIQVGQKDALGGRRYGLCDLHQCNAGTLIGADRH